jgi:membrane protein YqaA with SNARE-associated domain
MDNRPQARYSGAPRSDGCMIGASRLPENPPRGPDHGRGSVRVPPISPDVMLIPISLARPDRAWRYATICMLMSVAGGLVGYLIGRVLHQSVGHGLIQLYGYGDKVEPFRDLYLRYGAWIILIKGLTPIPYKIVTISSGFAGYNVLAFAALSIIFRGMRFYLIASAQPPRAVGARRDRTAACLVGRCRRGRSV